MTTGFSFELLLLSLSIPCFVLYASRGSFPDEKTFTVNDETSVTGYTVTV